MLIVTPLVLSSLVAFGVTLAGVRVVIQFAETWHLVDVPNPRSSHRLPTPRGGGVGILLGLFVGAGVLSVTSVTLEGGSCALLAATLVVAAAGLWDDIKNLSPRPRLMAHLAAAIFGVYILGGLERFPLPPPLDVPLGPFGSVVAVVWIVGVTNSYNFMDGIDGLAGGQAAASCALVLLASWSSDAKNISCLVLGAALGFLIFNWPPARIFLGDVGSGTLGFLLAVLPLLAPPDRRSDAVLATALGLTLFLLDPVETLSRRWLRGERLGASHRDHSYQKFLAPGDPHGQVTLSLVAAGLGLSIVGALTYRFRGIGWLGVILALMAYLLERGLALRAQKRREELARF